MSYDRRYQYEGAGEVSEAENAERAPGRRTLVQLHYGASRWLPAEPAANAGDDVHATAAEGARAGGGPLPHLDQIQRSFGHHDVSHVRAHTGPAADQAAMNLGARAYAMGDQVVLGATADLHTVAHEAAHVVQQRGGIQLAGGVGAAGDPYERHADAVADRVVRGESAVDLLDRYGGASPTAGTAIQLVRREATSSPQSVTIVREAIGRGDVGTMRALARAMEQVQARRREGATGLDHIVAVGGGDTYDLRLTPEDSTQLQTTLRERMSQLESEARDSAVDAGRAGTSVTTQSQFAQDFNRVFADIVPALRQAVPASADPAAADERASFMTDAELNVMFSPGQRAKLREYFGSARPIPDQLFNGDDRGGGTAQQRIAISNHILANGQYTPGSWAQRLYARYCGHWAQLVYHYAGVTQTGGRGVYGNFDHDGNLALGAGRTHAVEHGRTDIPEEEREGQREFIRNAVTLEEFQGILPGDWLYVHTGVDTRGGDHSVVFSHWIGPFRDEGGIRFRQGVTYDQGRPEQGGRRHERFLGFDDTTFEGHTIRRVSRIERPDPDAASPETVQDVIEDDLRQTHDERLDERIEALVGNGPAAQRNIRFLMGVERRNHGRIDVEALRTHIRGANRELIARLRDRDLDGSNGLEGAATEGQEALLTGTNASDDLETLVRLNERLNVFVPHDQVLATEDVEDDAAEAAREPEIRAAYAERMRLIDEIETIEGEMERADAVADLIPFERRARQSRDRILRTRDRLQQQRDRAREGSRRQRSLQARLDALQPTVERLERNATNLETRLRTETAAEVAGRETELRREPRSMRQRVNFLDALRQQLERNIAGEEDEYARMAHGVERGAFRGERSHGRPSGAIENVVPQPNWASMITPGEPGAAAEADRARRQSEADARAATRRARRPAGGR